MTVVVQNEIADKMKRDQPEKRHVSTLPDALPSDFREQLQQSTNGAPLKKPSMGKPAPAPTDAQAQPPVAVIPAAAPATNQKPAQPAAKPTTPAPKPATGKPAAAGPAAPISTVSGAATAPKPKEPEKDLEYSPATSGRLAASGLTDPASVGKDPRAQEVERKTVFDMATVAFETAHRRAQAAGEIAAIGSPDKGGRPGDTIKAWKNGTEANGDTTLNVIQRYADPSTPPAVIARYAAMMEQLKLPAANTPEDITRGLELFQAAYDAATERWNTLRTTLDKGMTPEASNLRAFQIAEAVEALRLEVASGKAVVVVSGKAPVAEPQAQAAAPAAASTPGVREYRGPDAGPVLQGGQLYGERAQKAAAATPPDPSNMPNFTFAAYGSFLKYGFEKEFWNQARADVGSRKPPGGGFWTASSPIAVNESKADHETIVLNALKHRENSAKEKGEDPAPFRVSRDANNRLVVDRCAFVAALTGISYIKAQRFNALMDGLPRFDQNDYTGLQRQLSVYVERMDNADVDAIQKINKLNGKFLDESRTAYKDPGETIKTFHKEIDESIGAADRARHKTGFGGSGMRVIGVSMRWGNNNSVYFGDRSLGNGFISFR